MENRKTFTYNGVNSADYGLYISGDSVYNAPSRVYDMVDIAGRNGQLAIDQGRFENIEVTYPAFIFAETQTEFAQRLREIRAWLMSPVGYQRLEDTYHPDEFRMAIYMSGLEADPTHYNEAGEFELTFNCKPQRFLKSGEEEITIGQWGETETVSGSIATFEAESNTGIKSLVVDIEPVQSGTGDPSPDNVRPISGWSGVNVNRTGKNLFGSLIFANGIKNDIPQAVLDESQKTISVLSGYISIEYSNYTSGVKFKDSTRYTVVLKFSNTVPRTNTCVYYTDGTNQFIPTSAVGLQTIVFASAVNKTIDHIGGINNNGTTVYYYEECGIFEGVLTADQFEPYQGETITKSLGRTVYGGTLDLVSGVLTSTLNADGTQKATPEVIQLVGEQIQTLLGVNNIWADSGEVSVEYGDAPNILVNPTPFEALPLIEVVGVGSLTVGNTTVTITGDSTQDIFIDSDIMEAYEDDNGAIISRNDRINLSGTDFPKLGEETRVEANGLTSVKITPKWWTI